jgi:hypothetical protein
MCGLLPVVVGKIRRYACPTPAHLTRPGHVGVGHSGPRAVRRTVGVVPCDYCGVEFDPISTRWLCPHCHMKANCCDGAPLEVCGVTQVPTGSSSTRREETA